MQLTGFTVANYFKTEKFYDLIGSVANITVPSICFFMSRNKSSTICRIQYACVVAWAARLGAFLFYRIMRDGSDRRFDKIKSSTTTFFSAWMIQGVWVSLTTLPSCCLFLYQNTIGRKPSPAHLVGWAMFATGFLFETIADHQKLVFKGTPGNEGSFIQSGLWSISRHPNYFGEITIWWGLYMSAVAATRCRYMRGSLLVSPLFVTYLLAKFSTDMLERSSEKKYGSAPGYQEYKSKTSKIIPFIY